MEVMIGPVHIRDLDIASSRFSGNVYTIYLTKGNYQGRLILTKKEVDIIKGKDKCRSSSMQTKLLGKK